MERAYVFNSPVLARPDFGEGVAHQSRRCTPQELFSALFVDAEEHVEYLEPAFEFARAALEAAAAPPSPANARELCSELVAWGRAALEPLPEQLHFASSWPPRVAREFAPSGLSDGAWLRGAMLANAIEGEVGMRLLRQLMLRFGDPASSESYAQRYANLLVSLGIPPDSISRWEWEEALPCAPISYEHALLGITLGCFHTTYEPECLGYNLWMAELGPCPLLDQLAGILRERHANLRYLELYDRVTLSSLAREAVEQALACSSAVEVAARIARGFAAAQESYQRWERAMLGRNVPLSPRSFVLEGIRRKARFASDHHGDVHLGKHNVRELLGAGGDAHERLLDALASSALVRPGAPGQSRLLSHSLSIDGPMFDAFTVAEKGDLAEWIAGLPEERDRKSDPPPIELAGSYGTPQDPQALVEYALERYGALSNRELFFCFANADRFPAVRVYARFFVSSVLDRLSRALDTDLRLNSREPPAYSERAVAEMVAEQHDINVRGRREGLPPLSVEERVKIATANIGAIFDGCWLQGFADVRRADFEEYGWLFRIYASEHGDGRLDWNHCAIFRREFSVLGPDVLLPKTDRRLYELFDVTAGTIAKLAISLNTRHFMPEILGLNLAIEASCVGGAYIERWKRAEGQGLTWEALAARLHNSIDNYADGHTKWSLFAVQSFMRRVQDVAPSSVQTQWRRIWRLWRALAILSHGSEAEQSALAEHLDVSSLSLT